MTKKVTTQLNMTHLYYNFRCDTCATADRAFDCRNNPVSERRFHAVPVLETAKKAASQGTKWRLDVETGLSGAPG
jgi:hypothetical protein